MGRTETTTIRVNTSTRDALNLLKRECSIDEFIARDLIIKNLAEDSVKNPGVEKSALLAALDIIRDRIAAERYYPEESQTAKDFRANFELRQAQDKIAYQKWLHDENMKTFAKYTDVKEKA